MRSYFISIKIAKLKYLTALGKIKVSDETKPSKNNRRLFGML